MDILFRDDRFAVLNKPAGLPVHAGPGGGASVEDWFGALSRRRDGPWLAHRLDADTSGCLVVALRKAALIAAQAVFAEGRAEKVYWAVVRGAPAGESGLIDAPLRKRKTAGGWFMEAHRDGDPAISAWRVMGQASGLTWLEIRPRTGRTHQVRVHCKELGTPIVGDPVYGGGAGRLHLLARFIHLPLDPAVQATAPPPAHMAAALSALGASSAESRRG